MSSEHSCGCCGTPSSVHQTLSEMEFERGLWSAAMNGDLVKVKHLVNKGTDVNLPDSSGYTALHYSCRYGRYDVTEYLLDCGACPNAQTRSGHVTSLQAAESGKKEVIDLVLRCDTSLKYHTDHRGKLPVDYLPPGVQFTDLKPD